MRIDRRLNLVVPLDQGDGTTIYVHSMPLGQPAFQSNYLLMAKAFESIYREGIQSIAGPKVAALILRTTAESMRDPGDTDEPAAYVSLMAEIRRLSNVAVPRETGWQVIAYEEALRQKALDPDEAAEAEGLIVFFMLASAIHKRSELPAILAWLARIWTLQVTSSNITEFAASLPTSTPAANSGETETASSIPH